MSKFERAEREQASQLGETPMSKFESFTQIQN